MFNLKVLLVGISVFTGSVFADLNCSYSNAWTYGSLSIVESETGQTITLKGAPFVELNKMSPEKPNGWVYVEGIRFFLAKKPTVFVPVNFISQSNETLFTKALFVTFNVINKGNDTVAEIELGDDAGTLFTNSLLFEKGECKP